jgi:hypothetical protein
VNNLGRSRRHHMPRMARTTAAASLRNSIADQESLLPREPWRCGIAMFRCARGTIDYWPFGIVFRLNHQDLPHTRFRQIRLVPAQQLHLSIAVRSTVFRN